MSTGLLAGVLWGLDTVILGIALAMSPFVSTEQAIALAPFISTFLHDLCSSLWLLAYMGIKKQLKKTWQALKTRSGKFIVLAAILGGPLGMSGYVLSINYIGPAYTAIISALFPALGAFLSFLILKEKMKAYQLCGLAVSILGVIALGYQPGGAVENFLLGILCALVCVIGWASEAVICAYGMKDDEVSSEEALQIRQMTSALLYAIILLPAFGAWSTTLDISGTNVTWVILASAFFGTASYLCYYKAISTIGPAKSMALNITYVAWAIAFSFILLHTVPSMKDIICSIVIVLGSITASCDIHAILNKNGS